MVLKDGAPWLSFGVMGGDMQAQGHVQVLANLIDFGMNIQEAGEAPRFRHSGRRPRAGIGVHADARAGLTARGHRSIDSNGVWGGFQGILIDPRTESLMAGSDPTQGRHGDRILVDQFVKLDSRFPPAQMVRSDRARSERLLHAFPRRFGHQDLIGRRDALNT